MEMDFSVKITNNKAEYEKALDLVAEKVLTMWGMQGESAAKKLAPVDTGLLRNSITWALAGRQPNTTQYKSNSVHATTPVTEKNRTAGKSVNVVSGTYTGQAPADKGGSPRSVYIGSNVEYAPYVELGTANTPAQPYLRPAIEENKEYFRNILESELKKVLPN